MVWFFVERDGEVFVGAVCEFPDVEILSFSSSSLIDERSKLRDE